MKKPSKRKRHSMPKGAKNPLPFPEPPPKLDVSDPRFASEFSAWCQRKAEWYGMDAIEMMARALGLKKPADQWRKQEAEKRKKEQQRLEDMAKSAGIYGG